MDVERLLPGLSTPFLPQPALPAAEQQPGDTREVAEQFTSLFMSMLVKEMWKTVSVDGDNPFGSGPGAEIYRGLAESAFAEALARDGMQPLTDTVHEHILRLQRLDAENEP
ncbi:MAG: hypothetical protein HY812_12580 [Planctomycetes bacterium]|nr:hypothetical protein [Planctomycetota bacterium]